MCLLCRCCCCCVILFCFGPRGANQIRSHVTQTCIYLLLSTNAPAVPERQQTANHQGFFFSPLVPYLFLSFFEFVNIIPRSSVFQTRWLPSRFLFAGPLSQQIAVPPPPRLRGNRLPGISEDPWQPNIREILFATEINLPKPSWEIQYYVWFGSADQSGPDAPV